MMWYNKLRGPISFAEWEKRNSTFLQGVDTRTRLEYYFAKVDVSQLPKAE